MPRQDRTGRRIALFVEGDSERGEARRQTLPTFFHRWLDPQLPEDRRIGLDAVKFHGVSNYLDDLGQHVELHLTERRANFVIGIVDLYGLPQDRINLSDCPSVADKVRKAGLIIRDFVAKEFQDRFRQYFAVHEIEAWLLAYPDRWPPEVRAQIQKRPPEQVNFNEPPAKFLKRILGGRYKKTVHAKNIFPNVDPQIAINKCPHLKNLADNLLAIAKLLTE